ncbi:MAG: hypothetical protein US42_C0004G0046 [Candidatus Magasanikbacteria bacterium GW2011_GWC2_37_14]|uniref:Uncharacterized protein n=1 Tax=Candidatus Magasanikbacteria bacterium GW2011_GWC2_37_14 TaxID=1619046 RepID=A0A0G0GD40_9BACT|nr:MAG: hypothetical protein US42_C0004G0046 [Candidatus Magasanikbacteria bacterium GW2011_GWC2_37_14]
MYKFGKIIFFFILFLIFGLTIVFSICPSLLVYIYRGDDEKTIWVETKYFPIKKNIFSTNYLIAPNVEWSPNGTYFSFYDYVRLEWATKEWALKIINARTFRIKTIFIGDYKTSEYKWIDNENVRVYEDAGSGVRIYRDININVPEPFIATDHASPEYWTPEKTF